MKIKLVHALDDKEHLGSIIENLIKIEAVNVNLVIL